jgi:hypothetical protein
MADDTQHSPTIRYRPLRRLSGAVDPAWGDRTQRLEALDVKLDAISRLLRVIFREDEGRSPDLRTKTAAQCTPGGDSVKEKCKRLPSQFMSPLVRLARRCLANAQIGRLKLK